MSEKIVVMGSDAITIPLLEQLHADKRVELVAVISQPDRQSGRGRKLKPNPLAMRAQELGLSVLKPEKPGAEEVRWLHANEIDLVVVMAYGHILRDDFLKAPKLGCINFHTSGLPKYRGASPVQGAIDCGEEQTGVSLMRIVSEMDAGAVAATSWVIIEPEDTTLTVEVKLGEAAATLMQSKLGYLLGGELEFTEQDHEEATFTRKLKKEDGWLNFEESALRLFNRIRAASPWPGAYFLREGERIKIGEAVVGIGSGEPGQVVFANAEGVGIATGDGVLVCKKLQRPAHKMLPAKDFLNGCKIQRGETLEGGEMPAIVR